MITKKQLRLLKQINRKPRTISWLKKKYAVSDPRKMLGGMFTLVHVSDAKLPDDCILTITKAGIIEIESHQWFDLQYVIPMIITPIVIGVASAVITNLILSVI